MLPIGAELFSARFTKPKTGAPACAVFVVWSGFPRWSDRLPFGELLRLWREGEEEAVST
jgi:hypothetical protein